MLEFYMINLPEKLRNFRILHDICPKSIFPEFGGCPSPDPRLLRLSIVTGSSEAIRM